MRKPRGGEGILMGLWLQCRFQRRAQERRGGGNGRGELGPREEVGRGRGELESREVLAFVVESVLKLRGVFFPLGFLSEDWPLPVWEEVSEGQLDGSSLLNIRLGYQKIYLLGLTARTPSLTTSSIPSVRCSEEPQWCRLSLVTRQAGEP